METPAVKWNTKSDSSAEVELQKGYVFMHIAFFRIKKKRSNPLEIRIEYVCSFVSQKYDIRYGYAKLPI